MVSGYTLRDDLAMRKVREEYFVLDRANKEVHAFNPVATMLWEMLLEGRPVDGLGRSVAEVYDVDRERAESDVEDFLVMLETKRLVALCRTDDV